MNDFLMIGIVGVAVSFLVEFIQNQYGTNSAKTRGISIGLAVLLGGIYTILKDTVWWTTILGVLGSASTVFAMFFSGKPTPNV